MANHRVGGSVAAGVASASAVLALAIGYRLYAGPEFDPFTLVVPAVVIAVLVFTVAVPTRSRRPVAAMAEGRVVAIIPAYNESVEALHTTIRSLLKGTRVPEEIHVVDDGSITPLQPLYYPGVIWHRQANGGKRHAQAIVFRLLKARGDADFILTIDSDCTVDRFAVQRLLESMADQRVQAATGLPLTRNMRSWLARVVDLEIASICLTYRAARSALGSLTTCSGALSLYRAAVVLDNVEDYVLGPNAGDDRRLTHYALLRGRVVSVPGAIVNTDMPDSIRQLYRQRVRWSSSHWYYTPWEIAHLPTVPMIWTVYNLVLSVIVPLALVWALVVAPLTGQGMQWQGVLYWMVVVWLLTLRYAFTRPDMSARERWLTWFLGVPVMVAVQLLVLRPAMVHALFKTRSNTWRTRESKPKLAESASLLDELLGAPA